MRKTPFRFVKVVILLLLLAGLGFLYENPYAVSDWYFLRSYVPPATVVSLANQSGMTAKGRRLFYRANPQIVTQRATMVQYCDISDNQVAELGCYLSTDHIYLLEISDPAIANEMVNTAGYEMLHSVYQRMTAGQRKTIDAQLEQVAVTITNPDILSQIQIYAKTEPGARDDELYSLLGTEYATLPAGLESNYAQYFTNRQQLVAYSTQFNQTFDNLHAQITQLGNQIDSQKALMQSYLNAGRIGLYNSLVPGINAEITTYNNDIQLYNQYGQEILGEESAANAQ